MDRVIDVIVLGLGPAGRATASACAAAGLRVAAIDPAPERRWSATYAAWADELTDAVPLTARVAHPLAWTTRARRLERAYCVLDSAALQHSLPLDGVDVRTTTATTVTGHEVHTTDVGRLRARLVLDGRGAPVAGRVQQVAHGVMVDAAAAAPVLSGADALFMDWRPAPGTPAGTDPSFLYAVPVADGRVLLEETSLAGRPGPTRVELAARLRRRLDAHDVSLRGDEQVERVRFALDTPMPGREWLGGQPDVPRLGAAAPVIHPATGFSVATSLGLAPSLAHAATADDPVAAVQRVLWSPGARAVHALRRWGLRVLLGLRPEQVPAFFDAFFRLRAADQRAYLSNRDDPAAMAAAMTTLLPLVPWSLRAAMVAGPVLRR